MIKVYKIGGNVVDNPDALARFIAEFAAIEGPKVLVHGGGKEASRMSAAMGIEVKMIDGRRITDRPTLDVVTMVYAGLVNKRVVSALQSAGCNAIGLTGADGNAITARRRNPKPIDYGFVGDIDVDGVNAQLISHLAQSGMTPVFCAIMHDGHGSLLNCNADSVAAAVAKALAKVAPTELIYCFEKNGVLADIDNPDSVIAEITPATYPALKADGTIVAGMIPKIDNAFNAVDNGVSSVVIRSADNISTDSGTRIKKQ